MVSTVNLLKALNAIIVIYFRTRDPIFQKFYLRNVVVPIASSMGLKDEYKYIEESINCFPNGILQQAIALKVGFKDADYKLLAGGQMGVLLLTR